MSIEGTLVDTIEILSGDVAEIGTQVKRIADYMPDERTLIAALALNGLLQNVAGFADRPAIAAEVAVDHADALLRRLRQYPEQKTEPPKENA